MYYFNYNAIKRWPSKHSELNEIKFSNHLTCAKKKKTATSTFDASRNDGPIAGVCK